MKRREFFQWSGVGLVSTATPPWLMAADTPPGAAGSVHEPARDVPGLLMAGRCISGDFLAHSSYRVTGNAVALGEAAGKTAAALSSRLPSEVPFAEIG